MSSVLETPSNLHRLHRSQFPHIEVRTARQTMRFPSQLSVFSTSCFKSQLSGHVGLTYQSSPLAADDLNSDPAEKRESTLRKATRPGPATHPAAPEPARPPRPASSGIAGHPLPLEPTGPPPAPQGRPSSPHFCNHDFKRSLWPPNARQRLKLCKSLYLKNNKN